jgi:hypothetical protein
MIIKQDGLICPSAGVQNTITFSVTVAVSNDRNSVLRKNKEEAMPIEKGN